jgi:integrase
LEVSGHDACKIIEEQGRFSNIRQGRIFPYNGRSVGAAFRRQCRDLKIVDLHFHDLRHEGTSRLFEAGFSIEQVALVTGHKDWKMLRRYTHLKPDTLHLQRKANVA